MALTKREEVRYESLEDGTIQVRVDTIVEQDGEVIATSIHRHVVFPGDDVSNEHSRVKEAAEREHTPEKVAAYQAKIQANENSPISG